MHMLITLLFLSLFFEHTQTFKGKSEFELEKFDLLEPNLSHRTQNLERQQRVGSLSSQCHSETLFTGLPRIIEWSRLSSGPLLEFLFTIDQRPL